MVVKPRLYRRGVQECWVPGGLEWALLPEAVEETRLGQVVLVVIVVARGVLLIFVRHHARRARVGADRGPPKEALRPRVHVAEARVGPWMGVVGHWGGGPGQIGVRAEVLGDEGQVGEAPRRRGDMTVRHGSRVESMDSEIVSGVKRVDRKYWPVHLAVPDRRGGGSVDLYHRGRMHVDGSDAEGQTPRAIWDADGLVPSQQHEGGCERRREERERVGEAGM